MKSEDVTPTVVIGGGPAGLATSRELLARGIEHVVLEKGETGESWSSRVYDSLTLHTGKHMSALPAMAIGRRAPLFVGRSEFLDYLRRYQAAFGLPVRSGVVVQRVRREDDAWIVETSGGPIRTSAVVVASGIMSNPVLPQLPGASEYRGRIRHSVTYRRPEECRGRRVLVVGAGNSAGEIASELGRAGVDTTIAIRSGANVVPLQLLGIPIQYLSHGVRKLPRGVQETIVAAMSRVTEWRKGPPLIPRPAHSPLDAIPIIGFRLIDAIRDGKVKVRGGLAALTPGGVLFANGQEESFDEIVLATGFRAAIEFLSSVTTDARGFGSRRDRVISTDHSSLFYVGHNYDSTGGLFNIRRDAPAAADAVKGALRRRTNG
ncbi:MAG TPA: NAD(P)/FAD-dependent oxidoreductase [Thermoanaerobaculia bacterium]|nr:NAD(P)/FAD-dependent oxidoreductase [Thermoanaerobaculia bacterium]